MTNILKTDLDFVCFYLLFYYHQNHLCLTNNMSNSSTPGFKAMALQDHLHYTDFKNKLLQQQTTLLQAKIL
jgi:flagellar basal body rod protein FlgG